MGRSSSYTVELEQQHHTRLVRSGQGNIAQPQSSASPSHETFYTLRRGGYAAVVPDTPTPSAQFSAIITTERPAHTIPPDACHVTAPPLMGCSDNPDSPMNGSRTTERNSYYQSQHPTLQNSIQSTAQSKVPSMMSTDTKSATRLDTPSNKMHGKTVGRLTVLWNLVKEPFLSRKRTRQSTSQACSKELHMHQSLPVLPVRDFTSSRTDIGPYRASSPTLPASAVSSAPKLEVELPTRFSVEHCFGHGMPPNVQPRAREPDEASNPTPTTNDKECQGSPALRGGSQTGVTNSIYDESTCFATNHESIRRSNIEDESSVRRSRNYDPMRPPYVMNSQGSDLNEHFKHATSISNAPKSDTAEWSYNNLSVDVPKLQSKDSVRASVSSNLGTITESAPESFPGHEASRDMPQSHRNNSSTRSLYSSKAIARQHGRARCTATGAGVLPVSRTNDMQASALGTQDSSTANWGNSGFADALRSAMNSQSTTPSSTRRSSPRPSLRRGPSETSVHLRHSRLSKSTPHTPVGGSPGPSTPNRSRAASLYTSGSNASWRELRSVVGPRPNPKLLASRRSRSDLEELTRSSSRATAQRAISGREGTKRRSGKFEHQAPKLAASRPVSLCSQGQSQHGSTNVSFNSVPVQDSKDGNDKNTVKASRKSYAYGDKELSSKPRPRGARHRASSHRSTRSSRSVASARRSMIGTARSVHGARSNNSGTSKRQSTVRDV